MLVVDLDQPECGARAQPPRLGLGHVRIVELAFEPPCGGEFASARGLDPNLQVAGTPAAPGRLSG